MVGDLHDRRVHVIGRGHARAIVLAGAVVVLEVERDLWVHAAHVAVADELAGLLRRAVEDHHVRVGDVLEHALPHVLGVQVKRLGVHRRDDLVHLQHLGRARERRVQIPHAVHLHDDAVGMMLAHESAQRILVVLLLVLDALQRGVILAQEGRIKLLHALLALDEQRVFVPGEARIAQHAGDEGGLAALQEAGKHIDRDRHLIPPKDD